MKKILMSLFMTSILSINSGYAETFPAYIDSFIKKEIPEQKEVSMLFDLNDMKKSGAASDSKASFSFKDASDEAYTPSMSFTVKAKMQNAFDVQSFSEGNLKEIKKGDVIFFSFLMRCQESSNESGEGEISIWLKRKSPGGWIYSFGGSAGREWQRFYAMYRAQNDYPADSLCLQFMYSRHKQTIEIAEFSALNLGNVKNTDKLPKNIVTYEGREANAEWRKSAEERIEKYRKGDLTIGVRNAQGELIKDAAVSVRMQRHAYRFGCYMEHPVLGKGSLSGSTWTESDSDSYRKWFLRLFNTAGVPMFWGPGSWGWSNPKMKEEYIGIASWASANKLELMGHCVIYEGEPYNPKSLAEIIKDKEALRKAVNGHISEKIGETKKYGFYEWQIINEHLLSSYISDNLDGEKEIVSWFRQVKEISPESRLIINDCAPWDHNDMLDRYEALAASLLKEGAQLEGIGFQAHASGKVGIQRILDVLDRFSKFNIPLEATEFDAPGADEQLQADYTRDFYTAFFSHPATDGIIAWGFWEGRHYDPSKALFRKDWSIKPNGAAYISLVLGKWWTSTDGKTDSAGQYKCRGFLGDYEITVRSGDKVKTIRCSLQKLGTSLEVKLD